MQYIFDTFIYSNFSFKKIKNILEAVDYGAIHWWWNNKNISIKYDIEWYKMWIAGKNKNGKNNKL